MRSFPRWVVGLSLLCLLPALLALRGAGEEPKAAEPLRAFSAQSGTSTPVHIASPTAIETQTPTPRPAYAPCPGGPGFWLPSSLNQEQFNDKLALELMYGSDFIAVCPVQDRYTWDPERTLDGQPYFASLTPYDEGRVQSVHTVVFIAAVTNERKERQYIVITEAVLYPGANHQLWGGVFQRIGNEWKAVVSPGFITEISYHAWLGKSAEDRRLEQIGPNKYGVLLRSIDGNQGQFGTEAHLIAEVDGRLKQIFSADVAGDDYGGCDADRLDYCYSYETHIWFFECGNAEYWPIRLSTVGTTYDKERFDREGVFALRDATNVQIYEFRDGAYSLVGSPTPESTTGASDQPKAGSTCGSASSGTPEAEPATWVMPTPNPTSSGTDVLSNMDRAAILNSLKRPEVIALREAIDAYANYRESPYLEDSSRFLPWGYDSESPFGLSFAGRFALLAEEPNLVSGINLHIVPENGPERVLIAWMVRTGNFWRLHNMWESAKSPDIDKRRIAAYKLLLSDPELGF